MWHVELLCNSMHIRSWYQSCSAWKHWCMCNVGIRLNRFLLLHYLTGIAHFKYFMCIITCKSCWYSCCNFDIKNVYGNSNQLFMNRIGTQYENKKCAQNLFSFFLSSRKTFPTVCWLNFIDKIFRNFSCFKTLSAALKMHWSFSACSWFWFQKIIFKKICLSYVKLNSVQWSCPLYFISTPCLEKSLVFDWIHCIRLWWNICGMLWRMSSWLCRPKWMRNILPTTATRPSRVWITFIATTSFTGETLFCSCLIIDYPQFSSMRLIFTIEVGHFLGYSCNYAYCPRR